MIIEFKNQTNRVVMMRLNSGQTLYLGPNASSEKILETEVRDNSRLKRLEERGIIECIKIEPKKPSPERSRKKTTKPKRKRTTTTKGQKTTAAKSQKTGKSISKKSTTTKRMSK